jgi:hypothetical protein
MTPGHIIYHHGFTARVLEYGPTIDEQLTVLFEGQPDIGRYEDVGIYISGGLGGGQAFVTRTYSVVVAPIPFGFR